MPVVELRPERLARLVGGGATRKAVMDALPYLGLDIEGESAGAVRVEYSPNRPDYSTDFGIARGLQGLLGVARGPPRARPRPAGGLALRAAASVRAVRPSVGAVAAEGGRLDAEGLRQLISMQEDLHAGVGRGRARAAIGIHDMAALSFPLSYSAVGRDYRFVPLGSASEMSVSEVLAGTAVGRKYGPLLGRSGPVPLISDAAGRAVSLPPVINAARTAVTERSRALLAEATGPARGPVEDALSVVAATLQAAGFALRAVAVSGAGNGAPRLGPRRMSLDPELASSSLGMRMTAASAAAALRRCRLGAAPRGGRVACEVPRHRFDILGPMDLVEEAALGHGIARLEPAPMPPRAAGRRLPGAARSRAARAVMAGLGYAEAVHPSLESEDVMYAAMGRDASGALAVAGGEGGARTVLRDSLLPQLAAALSRNVHEAYPQRLFEAGAVFLPGRPPREAPMLCAVSSHSSAGFTEAKSALQAVGRLALGAELGTRAAQHPEFARGRSADVVCGGRAVGRAGELSGGAMRALRLREPAAAFEVAMVNI